MEITEKGSAAEHEAKCTICCLSVIDCLSWGDRRGHKTKTDKAPEQNK